MRTVLLIVAILGLSIQAQASEPQSNGTSALPRDDASLSKLDSRHLRLVSRATNMCDASDPAFIRARVGPAQRPCIISSVDNAVETSNDPALQAYHSALPFHVRYDRNRPAYYWQQLMLRSSQ